MLHCSCYSQRSTFRDHICVYSCLACCPCHCRQDSVSVSRDRDSADFMLWRMPSAVCIFPLVDRRLTWPQRPFCQQPNMLKGYKPTQLQSRFLVILMVHHFSFPMGYLFPPPPLSTTTSHPIPPFPPESII